MYCFFRQIQEIFRLEFALTWLTSKERHPQRRRVRERALYNMPLLRAIQLYLRAFEKSLHPALLTNASV